MWDLVLNVLDDPSIVSSVKAFSSEEGSHLLTQMRTIQVLQCGRNPVKTNPKGTRAVLWYIRFTHDSCTFAIMSPSAVRTQWKRTQVFNEDKEGMLRLMECRRLPLSVCCLQMSQMVECVSMTKRLQTRPSARAEKTQMQSHFWRHVLWWDESHPLI